MKLEIREIGPDTRLFAVPDEDTKITVDLTDLGTMDVPDVELKTAISHHNFDPYQDPITDLLPPDPELPNCYRIALGIGYVTFRTNSHPNG